MTAIWIALIAIVTYTVTIGLVVIGQEVHPVVAILLFALVSYGAFKLFQTRLTRL
ncbi:MAG: hypothetical protein J0I17_03415 ['Candidatus Kapabacteria' thiocyanatum]|nr:hypothetical protein ['Candidatus Kapabacteria' thiocyanatum]